MDKLRKKVRRKYPEQDIQRALVEWARWTNLADTPDVTRPKVGDWLIHVPNERTSSLERRIMSALGVMPGVSDLFLALPRACDHATYAGLWLELKARPNKPSPYQQQWLTSMRLAGYAATWSDNLEDAMRVVKDYIDGRPDSQYGGGLWP